MTRRLENNLNNRISVALSRKAALFYEKAKQEIAVKKLYENKRNRKKERK